MQVSEVKEKIEELEDLLQQSLDTLGIENLADYEGTEGKEDPAYFEAEDVNEELQAWEDFLSEIESYVGSEDEWLIPEEDFEDYAREMASDLYGVDLDTWPFWHIDWDDAADDLKQDFAEVTSPEGDAYYVRAS